MLVVYVDDIVIIESYFKGISSLKSFIANSYKGLKDAKILFGH